jgi:membrane protease YdiL (CAAX protease family)
MQRLSGAQRFTTMLAFLGIVFAFVAYRYARRYALPVQAAVGVYLCFLLLLAAALAPGFPNLRAQIGNALARKRRLLFLIGLACFPYSIYAAVTGDIRWTGLARLLAIAIGLAGIYSAFPVTDVDAFTVQDACVAMALIGIVLSGQLRGIWNTPVNLDFMGRLFLVGVASWCWIFVRKVPRLGYEFRFSTEVIKQAALNFVYFAAIAIPASLAMHFTAWNPRWRGSGAFCVDYIEIFLFVALLEELFFRGFLQTLLSKTLGTWVAGQLFVAVLFGLFHILHRPFPNWRYVALASVAGWFYGSAFRNGGNLMASTLMHAAVDTVWRTWFTAG